MDSFHFLVKMEKNRHSIHRESPRVATLPDNFVSRVELPKLNELDSHFTVLDNINLPIEYIGGEIAKI